MFLAKPVVNRGPPTLNTVKSGRAIFDVSLTSMMVRWVQVSDFPCAMCSVRDGIIEWGFTSEAFKKAGAYRVNRGEQMTSRSACRFLSGDPTLSQYREEAGCGTVNAWLSWERRRLDVAEHYVAIPSVKQMLVLITADEEDVSWRTITDGGRLRLDRTTVSVASNGVANPPVF